MNLKRQPVGLTIIELLVVIVIIGVIVGLLLPATRSSREAARRMSCSNNIKQIGIGFHAYHMAHEQLPMQMSGTFDVASNFGGTSPPGNNRYRLSALVALLPFIEQQTTWDFVSSGGKRSDPEHYAPMGPAPWTRDFAPWQTEIPTLRCPSDSGIGLPAHGRTNIAMCLGDATHWINTGATRWDQESSLWVADRGEQIAASGRGTFVPRQATRFRQILDGLSNTIMAGEIATDLGDRDMRTAASLSNPWSMIHDLPTLCANQIDSDRPKFWSDQDSNAPENLGGSDQKRGYRWADGAALYTGFNTILPPNRESCVAGGDSGIGMLATSSRHQGGSHILMGDGAVVFVTDSIECGDLDHGTVIRHGTGSRAPNSPSPYGLWGALGTKDRQETIEEQLNQ